jgi:hypothetical protein
MKGRREGGHILTKIGRKRITSIIRSLLIHTTMMGLLGRGWVTSNSSRHGAEKQDNDLPEP